MFDINSIGEQLNWDYIFPSQVGLATLHGISNTLPNSPANLTKKFNQEQFSPMNYLPHTANNSLQAQYGIEQFKEGGTYSDNTFSGDMEQDMENLIMESPEDQAIAPTTQEQNHPISSFVEETQNEPSDEEIYNSMDWSTHQRTRYDESGNAMRTTGVNLQGVHLDVMQAGQELLSKFPGLKITSGVRNWGDKDAHPQGRALDFGGDKETLQKASEYYNSEIAPKYKFSKPLPLNHGSAPHIHLGYY